MASTTLRNILGTKSLAEILSDKEHIAGEMLEQLDIATDPWGIKVNKLSGILFFWKNIREVKWIFKNIF